MPSTIERTFTFVAAQRGHGIDAIAEGLMAVNSKADEDGRRHPWLTAEMQWRRPSADGESSEQKNSGHGASARHGLRLELRHGDLGRFDVGSFCGTTRAGLWSADRALHRL